MSIDETLKLKPAVEKALLANGFQPTHKTTISLMTFISNGAGLAFRPDGEILFQGNTLPVAFRHMLALHDAQVYFHIVADDAA